MNDSNHHLKAIYLRLDMKKGADSDIIDVDSALVSVDVDFSKEWFWKKWMYGRSPGYPSMEKNESVS
eukprot:TRINITY_DN112671_c0_g1_i1.p2 TRINITY_DN112671_c0_g1~~TRINITY_DN112671_c0_g1_i1.p2  ORF type:complete len:67 (-),score=15.38 TRINITY_DN112671_c0_g1_i1:259-459(-)